MDESQTLTEALKLLRAALHLAQHGEKAPGGDETWAAWAQQAETLLREADRPAGVVLVDDGSWTWHWTPTADGTPPPPLNRKHPTCIDVTAIDQPPRIAWTCGPDCPKEA